MYVLEEEETVGKGVFRIHIVKFLFYAGHEKNPVWSITHHPVVSQI